MRRLALVSLPFAAAIFLSNYILPVGWLLPCAGVFAALGLMLLGARQKWLTLFVLIAFGAAAGFGWFYAHSLWTTVPARLMDGEIRPVTARLVEYPRVYEHYSRAVVCIESEDLPGLNAVLYDNDLSLADAQPGDRLELTALISSADRKYGEKNDYYISRDVYLSLSSRSEILVSRGSFDLRTLPVRINRSLTDLIERIFPADSTAFMKSLMLGDKSDLYQDARTELSMSRAGLMHVLAVSGMHVAFLVGALQLLLGSNRRSAILCILLVWCFVLVTGSSPSAVRAALMQSFLLLAPVFRRENDPVTSLSAALALLLFQNPYASASVSLQLSFASMAGILFLGERVHSLLSDGIHSPRLRKLLRFPIAAAASSLAAMAFSLPLTAIHFGYVALLSPLSNILALWAVSFCFVGGYAACFLALLLPRAGMLAAWLIAWPARYIMAVAGIVSSIPFSAVYLQNVWTVLWIVFSYALFIGFAFMPVKRYIKISVPTVLSLICLTFVLIGTRLHYQRGEGYITVHDVGHGQSISVFSGDRTLVADCGGQGIPDNAGELVGASLRARGRVCVDVLLLTHLDLDHVNGVEMLMEMCPVKTLLLPGDPVDENGCLEEILTCCRRHGTQVLYVTKDTTLRLDGIEARLYAPMPFTKGNDHGLIAVISLGGYDMLVTGDVSADTERAFLATHPLRDIELLIVGHHGSRYSSSRELLSSTGARSAVVSVGYNRVGLPDQETLERIAAYGYNVYRTDESGSIEIRIG